MKVKGLLAVMLLLAFTMCNWTLWYYYDQKQKEEIEAYKKWELAHNVYPFDTDLLKYYKEYYYITESLLDSLDTQYHWKDYCKSVKYFEAQDIVNQYLNCCHE